MKLDLEISVSGLKIAFDCSLAAVKRAVENRLHHTDIAR
jgi:hypothetical protein